MRLPKRILACTDFSSGGDEAVAYAAELATALGAELLIAHLFDGFVVMQRELLRAPDDAERETRRLGGLSRLHELARQLGPRDGLTVRCLSEHGNPRTEIPRLAQREGADLIVVGRYGQSGVGHLFMGSVTDAIVRNASVPVLAVGNGGHVEARASGRADARRS